MKIVWVNLFNWCGDDEDNHRPTPLLAVLGIYFTM